MAILTPLPTTPYQWQHYSYSNTLITPQTSLFLRLHPSRFTVLKAVKTRDFNLDPKTWFEYGDDNDEAEFLRSGSRSRRRRRRIRSGSKRVKERQWWSGNNQVEGKEVGGIIDQLVHHLWILRVFRSYGWFLPIILMSFLLATGPKAFLMGTGIPFGLSVLAFAFGKLSEWLDSRPFSTPNPQSRSKRSVFSGRQGVSMEDDASQMRESQQGVRSERRSYQTRVNSFGGWDKLVTEEESERTLKPSTTEARLKMMTERKRISSTKRRELPLLMRLLVSMFPFLGSWTNLL